MKDKMGGVDIAEIVRLKPKKHSVLVNDSSQYKKRKPCE